MERFTVLAGDAFCQRTADFPWLAWVYETASYAVMKVKMKQNYQVEHATLLDNIIEKKRKPYCDALVC